MILIDSNVFMYAAGESHRHKIPSAAWLEKVARDDVQAAVDTEVLLEILERYREINRWNEGRKLYELVRTLVPIVVSIDGAILERARRIMDRGSSLAARDALHAAVVLEHKLEGICSFARGLDRIRGITRIEPAMLQP